MTKIYRNSKICVIGQNHTRSKIADPPMFSSFCTLTWSKHKNRNNGSALASVLFPKAIKYHSKIPANLRLSRFLSRWLVFMSSSVSATVLYGWMWKCWMWTYYRVLGFGCSEICFKNGRCSLIFKAGDYLELF